MLDRVVMNIFNVPDKVFLISDLMLPEAMLPYRAFFEFLSAVSTEVTFDQSPARRKIIIVLRKSPNAMEMLGKQDKRIDGERMVLDNMSERIPQERSA